jgi:transposase
LPPYSPDLNPIEKRWGTIKKIYRNYKHKYQNHYQIIDTLLCNQNVPT